MNEKYTYLFRKVGDTEITSYFVPVNMKPVNVSYLLNMLQLTHSSLRRFQIGVQKEYNGKKHISWNSPIYTVCDNVADAYKLPKNEIGLDKSFNLICGGKMTPTTIINKIMKNECILK